MFSLCGYRTMVLYPESRFALHPPPTFPQVITQLGENAVVCQPIGREKAEMASFKLTPERPPEEKGSLHGVDERGVTPAKGACSHGIVRHFGVKTSTKWHML